MDSFMSTWFEVGFPGLSSPSNIQPQLYRGLFQLQQDRRQLYLQNGHTVYMIYLSAYSFSPRLKLSCLFQPSLFSGTSLGLNTKASQMAGFSQLYRTRILLP